MSSIAVAVRVRPFNDRELKQHSQCIIGMPSKVQCTLRSPSDAASHPPRSYTFDHAFWTHSQTELPPGGTFADQQAVYEALGTPILDNAFHGYNSCLFAYGQTGSGKTFTMMGSPAMPGVIPQLCHALFQRADALIQAEAADAVSIITVECSYLEIYNENVRDLLNAGGSSALKVRQHPRRGVYVEGLTKVGVKGNEDVLRLLEGGGKIRAVASTNMNASSSRSHAILTLVVKNHRASGSELVSHIHLVDLAGSERAASTGAEGSTLLEGANINKSLTTLGMVLSKLAEASSETKNVFVPFRDSQLTWILNDSLGGNSRTAMLANISPASINFDETLSTLRFAMTVKKVKNHAVVNEDPQQRLIRELREEIETIRLQMQNAAAATAAAGGPSASGSFSTNPLGTEGSSGSGSVGEACTLQLQLAERVQEMQAIEEEQRSTQELVRTLREKIREMDALKEHLAVTVSDQQRQRFATAFRSAFLLSKEKFSSAVSVEEVRLLRVENASLGEQLAASQRELSVAQASASEGLAREKLQAEELAHTKRQAQLGADNATSLAAEELAALRQENARARQEVQSLRLQLSAIRTATITSTATASTARTTESERLLVEEEGGGNIQQRRSSSKAGNGCPCSVM